jgi:uridine kinase
MQITEYLEREFNHKFKNNINVLVGICGRAGSGKTFITQKIIGQLERKGIDSISYSGDWHFILDSQQRKIWLEKAAMQGISSYLSAINQFNWWDFERINFDLSRLVAGDSITLDRAYDRTTGKKNLNLVIPAINQGIIFYENAILGDANLLEKLNLIILINTPDIVCFKRIIMKDARRRTASEIAARFLVTSYSENIFFKILLENFQNKTLVCDCQGKFCDFTHIKDKHQIPVTLEILGF